MRNKKYKDIYPVLVYLQKLSTIHYYIRSFSSYEFKKIVWINSKKMNWWSDYQLDSYTLIDDYFLFDFFDEKEDTNSLEFSYLHSKKFLYSFSEYIEDFREFYQYWEDEIAKLKKETITIENAHLKRVILVLEDKKFMNLINKTKSFLPTFNNEMERRLLLSVCPISFMGKIYKSYDAIDYKEAQKEINELHSK